MNPKVSIIIPVFNQYRLLKSCIDSIKRKTTKTISYELVLVDDASTEPEIKNYLKLFPTETTTHPQNQGFIKSCMAGAKRAIGEYLLFLNSDTEVITPEWLEHMVGCFEKDEKIGIVGAKLLLANQTIQHAGMSYQPTQMNFMHDNYGKDRNDPIVCKSKEVEMVTGACLMTPRKVWDEIGGFDSDLKGGTFEDSILNIEVRAKGYKVWYCAEAELYHFQSQSMPQTGFTKREWYEPNWELFKQRYIRTGKLGYYPKVVACIIAFNEEDFITQCIKSVYDFAHKIIIIEGSTESTREFATPEGLSNDRTNHLLESFPDSHEKMQVIHGKWKDKTEMRNEYCKHLDGMDYAFIVDADEVWPRNELLRIEHILMARPELRTISVNMHEFWQDLGHKCRGVWENFLGRKTVIKLDKGLQYKDHINPVDKDGNEFKGGILAQDIYFFHYNYAKSDEKIKAKIQYYLNRGTPGFNLRPDWYETVWMGWKKAPDHVEKEYGTHPFGGGWSEPFIGDHPEAMWDHPKYKEFVENSGMRVLLTTRTREVKGYVNFDMEKHDIRNFPMAGLFEIVADDCLEHFSFRETPAILKAWYDRLRPGGRLTVITPDLRQTCENFISGRFDYASTVQFLYALQTYPANFHFVTFDERALGELLERAGFRNIKVERIPPAFMRVTGWK